MTFEVHPNGARVKRDNGKAVRIRHTGQSTESSGRFLRFLHDGAALAILDHSF